MLDTKYSQPEFERRWLVALPYERLGPFLRSRSIEDRYIIGTNLRLRAVYEAGRQPVYKLGKKYRSAGDRYARTVSVYLDEDEYDSLLILPAKYSRKTRLSLATGVIDLYELPAHEFVIFELEFASAHEYEEFTPPMFVDREITGETRFTGYALAVDRST